MISVESAAQMLHDDEAAHAGNPDHPSAVETLAQIWCRYLDRKGRPDPDTPATPADRDLRVEPLMSIYEMANLGTDAPASIISDIMTDLLHYAHHHGLFGENEGQVPDAQDLTDRALMDFRIERS